MKTTRKYNSRQIFSKQVIISILLAAILGVWNSARAQVENYISIVNTSTYITLVYINPDWTKEQINVLLAVDSEDEMVIEDWMLDPAYWEKVSEENEKKYHKLIVHSVPVINDKSPLGSESSVPEGFVAHLLLFNCS